MPDIKIDTDGDWVSVNTNTGITVGIKMKLQNKSTNWCLLQESETKPLTDDFTGENITGLGYGGEPSKIITEGSGEIWVRTVNPADNTVFMFVQVI